MIVCKFGGSSVATASQIRKVKAIVDADTDRTIVVVSAPGKRDKNDQKVTDLLYRCNTLVQQGGSCRETFKQVAERYTDILRDLDMDIPSFLPILEEVGKLIDAGHGAEYAASRGEYLCARLVASFFGWEFLDTASLIVIGDDGVVDDRTWENLSRRIVKGRRYVVPGFYGADREGKIRTFSRGGSDITGAIMARAGKARLYENWTDVSGIFSADPRLVPEARLIETMTYREIRELAGVGAGVFHEEAIAPVVASGIPINVRNTNAPDDRGTMIVAERDSLQQPVAGLAVKSGFSRIQLRKLLLFKKSGIRHGLLTMLHIFGIRPTFSLFGVDSIVWYFETAQASKSVIKAMSTRLQSEFSLDYVRVDGEYAVVGIVGNGVMEDGTLLTRGTKALVEAGIPMRFLNYGSSSSSILVGVDAEKAHQALVTLYRALF